MNSPWQVVHLGALSDRLRQVARHLFEGVLAPLGLFWLMLALTNLTGGLLTALGWGLAALLWRSFTLVGVAAVVSLLWFRRELRGEGIRQRFS